MNLEPNQPVNIGDGLSGWLVYRCYGEKVEVYRNKGQGRIDRKTVYLSELVDEQ